jgi:hypothetical protein
MIKFHLHYKEASMFRIAPERVVVAALVVLLVTCASHVRAEYKATIVHDTTFSCLVNEADFLGSADAYNVKIDDFVLSGDGSTIAFQINHPSGNGLYLMNRDGSGIQLVNGVSGFPSESTSQTDLEINYNGSKLFFIAANDNEPDESVYCFNPLSGSCIHVVNLPNATEFKKYALNKEGDHLFFRHVADTAEGTEKGLYYMSLGASPSQIINWEDLPCQDTPDCGPWYNNLFFLGVSGNGQNVYFSWNIKDGSGASRTMYVTDLAGSFKKVVNRGFKYVWDIPDPRLLPLASENGAKALFIGDEETGGAPDEILVVDPTTQESTFIAQSGSLGWATLSADGTQARFWADYFHNTLVNLTNGEMRDTTSKRMSLVASGNVRRVTAITEDNKNFLIRRNVDDLDSLLLADLDPQTYTPAPRVLSITFSNHYLLNDGETEITIYARVQDSQGLTNIEAVYLESLMEGRAGIDFREENSSWSNALPVHSPTELHDDGLDGDETAGDGIFTGTSIRTDPSSGFYDKYLLPKVLGFRVVVEDKDGNFCLADANLWISNEPMKEPNSSIISILNLILSE